MNLRNIISEYRSIVTKVHVVHVIRNTHGMFLLYATDPKLIWRFTPEFFPPPQFLWQSWEESMSKVNEEGAILGNKLVQTNYGKEPYRLVLRAPTSMMLGILRTLIMPILHSSSSIFTLSHEYMVWPAVNRHELVTLRMSFIMTWFVGWEMTRTTVKHSKLIHIGNRWKMMLGCRSEASQDTQLTFGMLLCFISGLYAPRVG